MFLKSLNVFFILNFGFETALASVVPDIQKINPTTTVEKLNQDKPVQKTNEELSVETINSEQQIDKFSQEKSDREKLNLQNESTKHDFNQLSSAKNIDAHNSEEKSMSKCSTCEESNNSQDRAHEHLSNDKHEADDGSGEHNIREVLLNKATDEAGFELTPEEMNKFKIWENGVIPYYIDAVSFSDKVARDAIRSQLQILNTATSLSFIELASPPPDEDTRWVFFLNRRGLLGCGEHSVKDFTTKGVQKVTLGYNCMATGGEIAEAIMSIVGVPAQHNDPRRDKYITINTENIMPDKRHLFEKLSDSDWLFHDLPYDFNSITHYDYNKYSSNGHATIVPKESSFGINPETTFSNIDIRKIKMLYNYIARNKKFNPSKCTKLFKRGSKFGFNKLILVPTIKPRRKPKQYTGIDGPSESPVNSNNAEDLQAENVVSISNTSAEDKDVEGMDYPNSADEVNNEKRYVNRISLKKMRAIDALTNLSDFHSDEKPIQKVTK